MPFACARSSAIGGTQPSGAEPRTTCCNPSMRRLVAGALALVAATALAAPPARGSTARHTDRWLAVLGQPRDARSPALVQDLVARAGARIAGPGAPGLG